MSAEAIERTVRPKLKIGQMPKPEYFSCPPDISPKSEDKNPIGVWAYSYTGEIKPYLWFTNIRIGDLSSPSGRKEVAEWLLRLRWSSAYSVVGPAINLNKSDLSLGTVEAINKPTLIGIYVDADKRPFDKIKKVLDKLPEIDELRDIAGNSKVERACRLIESSLPFPDPPSKR